ncbi:cyclin-J-like [Tropilaelaps mercedesae]|uniref:Cyclin-J-like n=1 Tax=Tropilaelaps mercedesae TaxID=418985 RepID=A0A1V9XTU2_9ACAR|nr:cyclin-J-like [Tropilaelaps mercedesae]
MLDAAKTLQLSIEVIQLAVYFYDRFVDHANRLFLGDRLEVQILSCLQLAAKSIEWDHHIPRGSDLNALLNRPYELSEYVRAERQMLLFFQWNVCVPVLSTFLGYFRENLLENVNHAWTRKGLLAMAEYFEKATVHYRVLQSLPCSQLASAVVMACRTLMDLQPSWPVSLHAILPYDERQQMHWAGFLISYRGSVTFEDLLLIN